MTHICVICLLIFSLIAQAVNYSQTPTTPPQTSEDNRIYLLRANTLEYDKSINPDFQILRGDVQFRQDSSYMYCDSAYFYEQTNSLDAFGNVRMEQGDTLFVYGDVLYYDGNSGLARLRDQVRMINRDVTLTTDSLNYDRVINKGYFFDGGTITDPNNRLISIYGEYSPDTKYAVFKQDVELHNPKYVLYSDTLRYNTGSGIADILGPSTIVSDSNIIYSDLGWYDTRRDLSMLLDRSSIVSKGQMLTGDTIYYDRKSGYGEVFGSMLMNDSIRKIILQGNYGFYNELTQYAFVTQNPLAIEYSNQDSLFLHSDTLQSTVIDSTRNLEAFYGVRFYRTDVQGVCDSLNYSTKDSVLVMYRNPVLWNQNYQIFGDTIFIQMNDSTVRHARIKDFAFLSQFKQDNYYDQLSGKIMDAWFEGGELSQMKMDGNVQTIFYPEEKDKSLIGLNKAESSFLKAFFDQRKLDKLIMWPQVNGSLTPLEKISPDLLYLPQFHWYSELRPMSKADIYRNIEMKEEDKVVNTRLFSKEELEGLENLDLPKVEKKVRTVTKTKEKEKLKTHELPSEKINKDEFLKSKVLQQPTDSLSVQKDQLSLPLDTVATNLKDSIQSSIINN